MKTPGTLYLVGTPIGNLGDITARALEVLGAADAIACEDTRRTRALLTHFGISKPLLSVPSHDEPRRAEAVAARLRAGDDVAFVTDAGMPVVSDPGTLVVRAALEAGALVVPIPGPSAMVAAVAASGIEARQLHFIGFLPRKGGERRRLLEAASTWPGAVVLHEAPGRLAATLGDLAGAFGAERAAAVCRELTKRHEEIARGTIGSLREKFAGEVKGEITIVVAGAEESGEPAVDLETALARVLARTKDGMGLKEACREVARETGHAVRALYQGALASGDG